MTDPYAPPPVGTRAGRRAGGRRPAGRPPDPEALRRASRRVMHFGLLMLATLLTFSLTLPWQAAALGFAVATVVVGIRAMVAVWRAGVRGGLLPVLGVGLGFAIVLSVVLATMLALWPLQLEYQQCRRDALTIAAQEQCEADFQQAVTDRLEQASGTRAG